MSKKETLETARNLVLGFESEYLRLLQHEIDTLKGCGCHHCLIQALYWEERYLIELHRQTSRKKLPSKPVEKQTQKDQGQGGAVSIPEEYWAIPLDDEMIGINLIKYIESLDIKDHWVLFHFSAYNIWTYYDKKGIPHYYDQDGDRLIPG